MRRPIGALVRRGPTGADDEDGQRARWATLRLTDLKTSAGRPPRTGTDHDQSRSLRLVDRRRCPGSAMGSRVATGRPNRQGEPPAELRDAADAGDERHGAHARSASRPANTISPPPAAPRYCRIDPPGRRRLPSCPRRPGANSTSGTIPTSTARWHPTHPKSQPIAVAVAKVSPAPQSPHRTPLPEPPHPRSHTGETQGDAHAPTGRWTAAQPGRPPAPRSSRCWAATTWQRSRSRQRSLLVVSEHDPPPRRRRLPRPHRAGVDRNIVTR